MPNALSTWVDYTHKCTHDTIELTVAWKINLIHAHERDAERTSDHAELLAKKMHEAAALSRISRQLQIAGATHFLPCL